jgi:soluble lytic murein transglycosylase-like protein
MNANAAAKKREARGEQVREISVRVLDSKSPRNNGHSHWEVESTPSALRLGRKTSPLVVQWERDSRTSLRKRIDLLVEKARANWRVLALIGFAFTLGFAVSSGPQSIAANLALREKLLTSTMLLNAREGELELTRMEILRLNAVMENSKRYAIPADLAAKIYDMAIAEGIDPKIAYGLVDVESDFLQKAISPVGALGLTQLMPNTAQFFMPGIERNDLFDPETNLRIGFRFLKELIAKYNGDVDMALHAYNRGPTIVDRVVSEGGNPANGYAEAVKGGQ